MDPNKVILTDSGDVLVTTAILAKILRTSAKSVAAWHKNGMPKAKTGWWDLGEVLAWRGIATSGSDLSDEARKLRADADYRQHKAQKEEISLAVLREEYVLKTEVDKQWATVGNQLKNNLLLWARTLAPELAHLEMRSAEKVLTDAVYDLLEQLSSKSSWRKSKKKEALYGGK